ncbi:MAG: hypothetical protein Q8R18_04975 [bacterium]|nr:hypothetical protein [bacterium]
MANDGYKAKESPKYKDLSELLTDTELDRRLEAAYTRSLNGKDYSSMAWWHIPVYEED